jgi:transposase
VITIGIDPHKSSLTAVAVDLAGYELGQIRLPVSKDLAEQLLGWAQAWPDRQWAVEGATGLGRGVAQLLASARQRVLDVPAKLAARARLLGSGSARKTDVTDAASVAAVAQRNQRLRMVQAEDHTVILRLLSDHRDHQVAERTRTLNRLHVLLRDLHPGGAKRDLSTIQAAALLRLIRPLTPVDKQRKVLARDLLADLRRLDTTIKASTKSLTTARETAGSTLTDVHGLGPVLAAKILAHSGDITRFPSRHHYARASNASSPTSSTSVCSPTTNALSDRALDTQRRYQATPPLGADPVGPHIAGQATDHRRGQRRNERTPPGTIMMALRRRNRQLP